MPLPATRFDPAVWKQATVQFNYHVAAGKMYYSVPYQYIRDKVDVRLTGQTVETFYNNERIASHKRLYGRPGLYSTVLEHIPKDHRQYLEWNGGRFSRWAKEIGPCTCQVINSILSSGRIEQQKYRSCMGVMKLAEKHTRLKLEAVCRKALRYSASPSYKSIKNLFQTLTPEAIASATPASARKEEEPPSSAITRGASHYGRRRQ